MNTAKFLYMRILYKYLAMKEIHITLNTPIKLWRDKAGVKNLDKLSYAIKKFGFLPKIVSPIEMMDYIEDKLLPYAAINFSSNASIACDSHLRYLRELELRGVKVINSVYDARIADVKILSYFELKHNGYNVPTTMDLNLWYIPPHEIADKVENILGFPCIIKMPTSFLGTGVCKINSKDDFIDLIKLLRHTTSIQSDGKTTNSPIAQQYIPEGNSVKRVLILDSECLGGELKVPTEHWKTQTTVEGGKRESFVVPEELKKISIDICRLFNLNFAAIDYFETKSGYVVNEVQTKPNFEGFESVQPGLNISELLIKFLIEN
jgi:glutathione synthase/RimK-type ligase-like ATP-grasp enzyme